MDKTQVVFTGGMLALVAGIAAWMAVGLWAVELVRWRAELGDQRAIEYLLSEAYKAGDVENANRWAKSKAEFTEQDMVFMLPESRKAMRMLQNAQGKPTPLLDIIND